MCSSDLITDVSVSPGQAALVSGQRRQYGRFRVDEQRCPVAAREFTQGNLLHEQFAASVSDMGMAGKVRHGHCAGGEVIAAAAAGADAPGVGGVTKKGRKLCGSVARCAAAGSVGRNSTPFWPQPARLAAQPARTIVLTRIRLIRNMVIL